MTYSTFRVLRFEVEFFEREGVRTPHAVPLVDGDPLGMDLRSRAVRGDYGIGVDPDLLLGRRGLLVPQDESEGQLSGPRRAPLWRSSGVNGPVSISARVIRRNVGYPAPHDSVVWLDWAIRNWGDLSAPGELHFDPEQYVGELIRADADRWWEDASRTAARHVEALLDASPEILGVQGFALVGARGYVFDGTGNVDVEVRSSRARKLFRFECDARGDGAAVAREIVAELGGADLMSRSAVFSTPVI